MHYFGRDNFSKTETYSEPCQTNKMKHFAKKSQRLLVANYFCKAFHLRCLTGFWIHRWKVYQNDCQKNLRVTAAAVRILSKPGFLILFEAQENFWNFPPKSTVMEQIMIYYGPQKLATLYLLNFQQFCTILKGKRFHQTQAMFFWITDKKFILSHNVCPVYCLRT